MHSSSIEATEDELKQIARLRLAEVQLDDKQYDDALRTLDAKTDDSFAPVYADLRGDILVAAGRTADARTAYETALGKFDANSQYRPYLQAKLDAVGGPTAAAAAIPGAALGRAHAPGSGERAGRTEMRARIASAAPSLRVRPTLSRLRVVAALCVALSAGGCATLSEYMPTIPPPSFDWLTSLFGYGPKKPGPLPEINATVNPQVVWQVSLGKAAPGFTPAITPNAIYAAVPGGTIIRVDPATGASAWRIEAGTKLSAGVGADATLVVVGTNKGEVLAFDTNGKPLWQSKISSEVVGPPKVAEGTVVGLVR